MTTDLAKLQAVIANFSPSCEQEERDKAVMLDFLSYHSDCLTRENKIAHFTASAWIVNESRTKILMAYHNIYDSWSWTGGHADGDADLLRVALREATEETGVTDIKILDPRPCSLEIITVDGHIKRDSYVPSHLHLNLTFLFQVSEEQQLRIKADENSGVKWIPADDLADYVSEPWMMTWIYEKLLKLQKKLKKVSTVSVDTDSLI